MTIFNYEENNYMKNEINSMSSKKRRNTFKLMSLIGNFKLKSNLYLESYEEEDNTRIITYDKDGNKLTFYPRSNNERLENVVFKKNSNQEEAYEIPQVVYDSADYLKIGNVYDFPNAKLIIKKQGVETSLELLFIDGVSYIVKMTFISFNSEKFLLELENFNELDFSQFINIVSQCTSNYAKFYNYIEFKCLGMGLEVTNIEIQNGEILVFNTLEEQVSLKRVLKNNEFTLNE